MNSARRRMNGFVRRADAEDKAGSAVEIAKGEAEFGAGIFRIDRLVRIEARFFPFEIRWGVACKYPAVWHSDFLTFYL